MEVAGACAYAASNVMLVRNESSTDVSLVAMLASCAPVAMQATHCAVQRAGAGVEDSVGSKRAYYPAFSASGEEQGEEDTGDDCSQHVEKKRRLSFEQVKSLEKNFDLENKLEPERKMQLARELGLQPRQVAVWFQNRRARWKTKQLERDYEVLTSDYNRLKTDYDAVLQEKLDLQVEIDYMTGKLQTTPPNPAPEKSEGENTELQVAMEAVWEGPAKLEGVPLEVDAGNGEFELLNEDGSRAALSPESLSSEILDSDSPREMDSNALVISLENLTSFPHISGAMVDGLLDPILSALDCHGVPVKSQDGLYQTDNCAFVMTQLEDAKNLGWWEWA